VNIEKKLQHFMDLSMLTANQERSKEVSQYEKIALENLESYKQEAIKKAELDLRSGKERILRECHRNAAATESKIKKEHSLLLASLKEDLFSRVLDLLEDYKSTQAYEELLYEQIKEAIQIADGKKLEIYLDPSDLHSCDRLAAKTGLPIYLSAEGFLGGIQAVIKERNLFIDHSFLSVFQDQKAKFHFKEAGYGTNSNTLRN